MTTGPSTSVPCCTAGGAGRGCGKGGAKSGRGQSGCAFLGAKMALQPITDAVHLGHGPASCETGSWSFSSHLVVGPILHRISLSTDLGESDILQGGERKLFKAIGKPSIAMTAPPVFVYQTCLPAMIGDDIGAVCGAAAKRWGRPVIPVEAHGFAGNRPYGNHLACEALLRHVVGNRRTGFSHTDRHRPDRRVQSGRRVGPHPAFARAPRHPRSRQHFGRWPLPGDRAAHRAKAAVLLCSQGLARLAEGLREGYGIPFVEGSSMASPIRLRPCASCRGCWPRKGRGRIFPIAPRR